VVPVGPQCRHAATEPALEEGLDAAGLSIGPNGLTFLRSTAGFAFRQRESDRIEMPPNIARQTTLENP
jgi:hypothetical protein